MKKNIVDLLNKIAPEIMNGSVYNMEFNTNDKLNFHLQENESNVFWAYKLYETGAEGCTDINFVPRIDFKIDRENNTFEPLSFQNDELDIYYEIELYKGEEAEKIKSFVSDYLEMWLHNISSSPFEVATIHINEPKQNNTFTM